MIKRLFFCVTAWSLVVLASCSKQGATTRLTRLRCEYLTEPLGIDVTHPRLSWEIEAPGRGVMQTAYQVLVASTPQKLTQGEADLWNSGRMSSDSSVGIRYEGQPLASRTDCYWEVKVWLNNHDSIVSEPQHWSMGLLKPADWDARWVGLDTFMTTDSPYAAHTRLSARYLRKDFKVAKQVAKARLYISGLGIYQLYIDGKKIGREELSPDPTQYDKRVFYNTFDVRDALSSGDNTVGVILGNGRFFQMRAAGKTGIPPIANFGYPKMLLQLEITYDDGSVEKVVSDSSWQITPQGPVVANNEYDGEDYDALKEMPGWDKPGFQASGWQPAQLVAAPADTVEAQMDPLIRVMDTVKPKSVFRIAPGKYIVDMGQNMVGWAEISIPHGKKGDTVKMHFAERINPDSTLYTANLRGAEATDRYVMKDGSQQWEPHFTYHGFRYIEVTGYPGTPSASDFLGKVVYDDLPTTGTFTTSNDVINQVYHNAYWGIRGNYRGMPTDCPQRDERMGWLGDRAVGSYGESFIFDNNTLYAKWLQDIQDAQRADGSIPDVAPTYWKIYSDNMTWPAAYVIIANTLNHQFSNEQPIIAHYASIKKWLFYMRDKYMKDYIMPKDTYGDWCMPPEDPKLIHSKDTSRITPGPVLGTAFYYRLVKLMEHFATITGNTADAQMWDELGTHVRDAFNKAFLNPANDQYANNTATANVFALAYRMAPDSIRHKVFLQIIDKTMNDFHGHISTGLVGAQWLMRTLTAGGRPDIAYKLATNTTYPSWGYMAKEGATTIWELWNGNTADPAMNSGNHVMLLGDLVVWFYEDLAGIRSSDSLTGFRQIEMKPYPVKGLDHVAASYHSVRGMISSSWSATDGQFSWDVTVPANTTAEVYIPAASSADVTEGGKKADGAESVKFLRQEGSRAVFQIGSGTYHFVSKSFKSL